MNANDILPRLKNVSKAATGWNALCPSHNDNNRSLAVNESNGKILLKCFAGCETTKVVADLGLTMQDLFTRNSYDFLLVRIPLKMNSVYG